MSKLVSLNNKNIVVSFLAIDEDSVDIERITNAVDSAFETKLQHMIVPESMGNIGMGSEFFEGSFRPSKPFPSWLWDGDENGWAAPAPHPHELNGLDGSSYEWDEFSLSWTAE